MRPAGGCFAAILSQTTGVRVLTGHASVRDAAVNPRPEDYVLFQATGDIKRGAGALDDSLQVYFVGR